VYTVYYIRYVQTHPWLERFLTSRSSVPLSFISVALQVHHLRATQPAFLMPNAHELAANRDQIYCKRRIRRAKDSLNFQCVMRSYYTIAFRCCVFDSAPGLFADISSASTSRCAVSAKAHRPEIFYSPFQWVQQQSYIPVSMKVLRIVKQCDQRGGKIFCCILDKNFIKKKNKRRK